MPLTPVHHTVRCRIFADLRLLLCRSAETVAAIPAVGQPHWSAAHTVVPVARVPNGMAWTADQRTLFWIDSALNTVDVFDYDPSSGEASNRRVAVTCPKQGQGTADGIIGGIPDGATIDAAGKLWVALAESGHVVQYDPNTGKQLMAVALPVQRVTACTFGGDDLSELFVTTREETGPGASPHAGGLFKLHLPGVRGLHGAYEMQG
jgi:sugar lactone lactonase YvrE